MSFQLEKSAFPIVRPGHLYGDGSSEPPEVAESGLSARELLTSFCLFAGYQLISWQVIGGTTESEESIENRMIAKAMSLADKILLRCNPPAPPSNAFKIADDEILL